MTEYLPLVMMATLFAALLAGYPVAFTLGGVSLMFGLFGFGLEFFDLLPMRIWGVMTNFTLMAVPLFVFMGVMLERSGLAEDLIETMALLFGRLRGGMAIAVILVGTLLAATTGIVGATVVTMGLLALPSMIRRNYQPELATGVIAAAGTLGQIIPPSVILVLLGDIMNISVGDLYLAAIAPGFMLVFLYIAWVALIAFIKPEYAPAIPKEERDALSVAALWGKVGKALVPPLLLILAVLGSIFAGIASPTESAAMGGVGAMILTAANGKLTWETVRNTMQSTTRITCMVFTILVGASAFTLVFRGLQGDDMIRELMSHTPFGPNGALAAVMIALFILGCFLDFIEITFIVIPIIAPIMVEMGFNPLWFAILVAMNLQTSFLTPPFGFSLFYLKGVAPPSVTTGHIYRGVFPFIVLQVIALVALIMFPQLATWLPEMARKAMFG